jgi:hypothetical protein
MDDLDVGQHRLYHRHIKSALWEASDADQGMASRESYQKQVLRDADQRAAAA